MKSGALITFCGVSKSGTCLWDPPCEFHTEDDDG